MSDELQQLKQELQALRQEHQQLVQRQDMLEECIKVMDSVHGQRILAVIGNLATAVAQHTIRSATPKDAANVSFEFRLVDNKTELANTDTFMLHRLPDSAELYSMSPTGPQRIEQQRVPMELLANKFAIDNNLPLGEKTLVNFYVLHRTPAPTAPEAPTETLQ